MPAGSNPLGVRRGGDGARTTPGFNRSVAGVTTGRLPRIGAAPVAPQGQGQAARRGADEPAWIRFAAPVDLPAGARPMGVVLIDNPDAEGQIASLPFAATIALDPFDPDAPRRAAVYRASGHEIALLARNIPAQATPSDIAVTLDAFRRSFPDAVALTDIAEQPIGASQALARDLAQMMVPEGLAVIARRAGLDAFLQAAREAGLAAVGLYRVIDARGQSATTMRRLIDRAAFEAARRDGVVIAGSAENAGTLRALEGWANGAARDSVVLAPVTAVLRAEQP